MLREVTADEVVLEVLPVADAVFVGTAVRVVVAVLPGTGEKNSRRG